MEHTPTWQNTLYNHARNIMHIGDMATTADELGYPYMCWNDRIYVMKRDGITPYCEDIGLTVEDVK